MSSSSDKGIVHQMNRTWLKGNPEKETESPVENNAQINNGCQAKIDNTQKKSRCTLYGNRDETFNPIISECSKLAQNK